jgi:hypothetical protein|tara:strand:- start:241 stop:420 length:180 start_codon:yes stop_codon:yes gene_type:complete
VFLLYFKNTKSASYRETLDIRCLSSTIPVFGFFSELLLAAGLVSDGFIHLIYRKYCHIG